MPTDGVFGSYYSQAISKFAPHPAAARLWEEFLYSDEGQNLWLKGLSRPVRLPAMQKAGTADEAALAGAAEVDGDGRVPDRRAADRGQEGRRGPLERGDVRLSTARRARGRAGSSHGRGRRGRALTCLGALPFFLYVAVFLLPARRRCWRSRRSGPPTRTRSRRPGRPTRSWPSPQGPYRRAYLGSLQLSADHRRARRRPRAWRSAVAILRTRRNLLLRRLVLTASGVLANFGGVPLAFAFLATLGNAGVVTALLTDTRLGLGGFYACTR